MRLIYLVTLIIAVLLGFQASSMDGISCFALCAAHTLSGVGVCTFRASLLLL